MDEKPQYLEQTQLLLQRARNIQDKDQAKLLSLDFVIYSNVFNPNIFDDEEFGVQEIVKIIKEFHPKQPNILEIGTGAGYVAIIALLNGASHATCTDINRDALKNAEENAIKHKVNNRITFKYSDVFSALSTDDKFDIIFWNIPFSHTNKPVDELDILERALFDPFHKLLDAYVKDASKYLRLDGGRLFIEFSTSHGHKQAFQELANRYSWNIHLRREILFDTDPVEKIGFYELTKVH